MNVRMKIAVAMRADHAKNDRVVNAMYLARLLLVSVGKSDGERASPAPTIHLFIYAYGADWGNRAQYTYVWWGCGYCMSCPPTPFGIGQGLKYLRLKSPTALVRRARCPPASPCRVAAFGQRIYLGSPLGPHPDPIGRGVWMPVALGKCSVHFSSNKSSTSGCQPQAENEGIEVLALTNRAGVVSRQPPSYNTCTVGTAHAVPPPPPPHMCIVHGCPNLPHTYR